MIVAAAIVTAVLCFVFAVTYYALRFPERVVNERTVSWVLSDFVESVDATWKDFSLDIRSESLLEKVVSFDLAGICVDSAEEEATRYTACFDRVSVRASLSLRPPFSLDSIQIHSADMRGGRVEARLQADSGTAGGDGLEAAVQSARDGLDSAFDWMTRLGIGDAYAGIDSLRVVQVNENGSPVSSHEGKVELNARGAGTRLRLTLSQVTGSLLRGDRTRIELEMDSKSERALLPGSLRVQAGVFLPEGRLIAADLNVRELLPEIFPLRAELKTRVTDPDWTVQGAGSLVLREETFSLQADAGSRLSGGDSGPVVVHLRNCRVSGQWEGFPAAAEGRCHARYPLPPELDRLVVKGQLPKELSGRVSARVKEWVTQDEAAPVVRAALAVMLDPFEGNETRLRGRAEADFTGTLDELRSLRAHDGEWNLDIRLADFQALQTVLRDFDVVVPAPFSSLRGPMHAVSEGKLPADLSLIDVPLKVTTDLKSENQRVDGVMEGVIRLNREGEDYRPSFDLAFTARDVQLVLPTFDIRARPPRVASDPRVITRAEKQGAPPGNGPSGAEIDYRLTVRTARPGAFRLVTEHAKKPIPIGLDLVIKSESESGKDEGGVAGLVDVQPVDLVVFRREARLKDFKVDLRPDMESSPITGELEVDYADYTITVQLLGTVSDVIVQLQSDPPLSEEDVLAVLIFGQPLDRLTSEQGSSVAGLKSAFAAGTALGTLYLLAATPIEQIVYDPLTDQVTARIRLDEATSISVGMGGRGRAVGGRRRLGNRWVIGTEVIEDRRTGESRVSTFLEWHYRY